MKKEIANIARAALLKLGIAAMKASSLDAMLQKVKAFDAWSPRRDSKLLSGLSDAHAELFFRALKESRSQLRQDLFVLSQLDFKRGGFFVEFGATNGVDLSNTHLLEKQFGWSGVLAEPARSWHASLKKNRSAKIETSCVWRQSGCVLKFNEAALGELSTIDSFSAADFHEKERKAGRTYDVETISLNDLLERHGAPRTVDYLSIDTEGSELEILRSFDFSRHSFTVITCEHNYTPAREEIHSLLTRQGYVRKYVELSEFDDWYVKVQ